MRNWTSLGPLCATTAAVVATIALSGCATPVKDERMRTGVTTSADAGTGGVSSRSSARATRASSMPQLSPPGAPGASA